MKRPIGLEISGDAYSTICAANREAELETSDSPCRDLSSSAMSLLFNYLYFYMCDSIVIDVRLWKPTSGTGPAERIKNLALVLFFL